MANPSNTGTWSARALALYGAGVALCALLTVVSASARVPSQSAIERHDDAFCSLLACEEAYASESEPADAGAPGSPDTGASSPAGSDAKGEAPVRPVDRVEALLQMPELPAGCEAVALTIALNAEGFAVEPGLIVDEYLAIDPSGEDFVTAFAGDPRAGGGALPPALADAANAYLSEQGAAETARDLTGSTFDELIEQVEDGLPVLVWTTMYLAEPAFTERELDGYRWYSNEHCVVFYGTEDDEVLVSDPLEGLVRRDAAEFQRLYEACGSMAAVIR